MTAHADLFRQARERVDVARLSGVLRGQRGPCPLCEPRAKRDTAFQHNRNGSFKCWRCGAWGDSVELYAMLHGHISNTEAARAILGLPLDGSRDGDAHAQSNLKTKPGRFDVDEASGSLEARRAYRSRVIADLDDPDRWHPATTSRGVRAWLGEARGIAIELIPDALERLRAAPAAYYAEDFETGEIARHPAMVGMIENAEGEIVGRHCTYLASNWRAKADVDAPRKVWGSSRGGVWLTGRDPVRGPLHVAEGIETALSLLATWREQHGAASGRALAVLSLGNLQGGWRPDRLGRIDPERPEPDPDRPAITWPNAGTVVLGVDHDMRDLKVKVRKQLGGTESRWIDGTTRMRASGILGSHWWREAKADDVRVASPPAGMDWNDALLAKPRWVPKA